MIRAMILQARIIFLPLPDRPFAHPSTVGLLNHLRHFQWGSAGQTPAPARSTEGCATRPVQQDRRPMGARSVQAVREHDTGPRTPRVDVFNNPTVSYGPLHVPMNSVQRSPDSEYSFQEMSAVEILENLPVQSPQS